MTVHMKVSRREGNYKVVESYLCHGLTQKTRSTGRFLSHSEFQSVECWCQTFVMEVIIGKLNEFKK